MAKLATCPGCTTQLALPEEATLSDDARCPRCGDEFPLMEVVQFSIPTAELIPASERRESSEVAEWAAKTMEPADLQNSLAESASADETDVEEVQPAPLERADSDLTATLSDWEARLKRAISDTEPSEPAPTDIEAKAEPDSVQSEGSILPDFSFPHEDLEPISRDAPLSPAQQSRARIDPEPVATSWKAVETEEFDFDSAEPTVNAAAAATVADLVVPPESEMVIDTSPLATPRNKRPPSLSRTLLSASLGIIGIPLGLYALLWIKGPAADVAHLADYLPRVMLPASMQTPSPNLQEGEAELAQEDSEALPSQDEQALPPLVTDPEVQPATAEMPVYSGPRFAMVKSEEFGRLLADARQAIPDLAAGDLADKSSKNRKGHAYMALCRLADKCSFMNQPGLTAGDADRVAETQELWEAIFSSNAVLKDLPMIALPWWQFAARPSPGMVLAGRVERVEATAAGSLAMLQLGETGALVPVLLGGGSPLPGTQIGVVGSIVQDPATAIPALSEMMEPVVVAHLSLPILDAGRGENASASQQ